MGIDSMIYGWYGIFFYITPKQFFNNEDNKFIWYYWKK